MVLEFMFVSGSVKMFVVFCRFQVNEETEATLDDLSDCSSDSMEVCCDDLGEFTSCFFQLQTT